MAIAALIVTCNRLDKLKACWAASARVGFKRIVIVDNASDDGTAAWLATLDDPRLQILTLPANIGGAGGFRQGAHHLAAQRDIDWVVFHDDDAAPPIDLIERFAAIQAAPWQAYCCKVVDARGVPCRMNLPYVTLPQSTLGDILAPFVGRLPRLDPSRAATVGSFSFVGLILDHDVLRRTHDAIDDSLFLYFDDLYYAYDLTRQGIRIRYSPEIVFTHDVPATPGAMPPWKIYYLVRNLILSRRRFRAAPPYSVPSILLRIARYALAAIRQPARRAALHYLYRGVRDGVQGRTGRRH
ncbi:glycosyltransferase [Gluconacetobacter johannae DSM 13595]|uniref:Glycosyltransferase n=1 Tax=Gluconacetobacter johannae TaxID=112140 RepID=A0A7W4J7E3_9PROT|nr:glycosyltransferase [Gluconacetobacter johannae]MBB2175802.1 glycosyltransferase [Gluconacetobacter johannae]GBQ82803.1 glycosyltransferase [Gluconacetobacter johannae DSM 13595]